LIHCSSSNKWHSSKDKESLTKKEVRSESRWRSENNNSDYRFAQSAPSLHVIDEATSDDVIIQSATEKKREQRTQNRNSSNDVRPSELLLVPDKPARNDAGGRARVLSSSTSDVTVSVPRSPATQNINLDFFGKKTDVDVNSNQRNSYGLEAHLIALSSSSTPTAVHGSVSAGSDIPTTAQGGNALKSCISSNSIRPAPECRPSPQQQKKKNMFSKNCCKIM